MDDMPVNSFKNYFLSWAPEPSELGRPCYLSIANLLEDDIRSGRLAPGTKLPPQRELADYLDINFSTVTRAYNLCRERRLIYGSTGKGTFVSPLPGVPGDESSSNLIELGVVNGFDNVSKQIIEATEAVLSKGYVEKLYSHTSALGHKHQRVAAMNWMRKFNVSADEEHTVLFSGSQNAISAALLSLFKLGDVIAVDVFTYANLIGTAKLAHIRLLPVAGDAGVMIPEALDECCRKNRVSGIFLMPNCANPTVITLGDERKRALAEVIRKYGLILIEDDTAPTLPAPGYISLYSLLPEQTMYICGNLRSLCGGLRVTAAAFPEKFRNYLLNGLFLLNIRTSPLDAEIMTELMLSGKAEAVLNEKMVLAKRANKIFDRIFPESSAGERFAFFRTLELPSEWSDPVGCEAMFEAAGVKVLHSARFSVQVRPPKNFLRLSVSSAGSEKALDAGLKAVRELLN